MTLEGCAEGSFGSIAERQRKERSRIAGMHQLVARQRDPPVRQIGVFLNCLYIYRMPLSHTCQNWQVYFYTF